MQFGGAFWATLQRFQMNNHALDTLLSREGVTLEDLLNDDNIIQETKNQNQKLMDFLNAEKIEKLIELVTIFPEENADKKRTQNHPFVACEMLSEPGLIHDKILENEELLVKTFAFLNENKLNPTLAGYFGKVVNALLNRNSEKALGFLIAKEILPKLVQHLYNKSIVDISLKILTIDSPNFEFLFSERKAFLQLIIDSLRNSEDYNVYFAGFIINDILSRENDFSIYKELFSVIINKENVESYFRNIASEDNFKVNAGIIVLKSIFTVLLKSDPSQGADALILLDVLTNNLETLIEKLKKSNTSTLLGTFQESYEPLGEHRLRIVELLSVALKFENQNLYSKLAESKIFAEVFQLFFRMHWNSMLHNSVFTLINNCISTNFEKLIESILISSDFLTNMINTVFSLPSSSHRLGYLGHINKLGNFFNKCENETVKKCLKSTEHWESFNKEYLENRNRLDSHQLGENNKKPESSSSEEENIENSFLPSDRKDIYSSYGANFDEKSKENNEKVEHVVEEEMPEHTEEEAGSSQVETENIEKGEGEHESIFKEAENLIKKEVPSEIVAEANRAALEIQSTSPEKIGSHEETVHEVSQISPKNSPNARTGFSPVLNPEYQHHNFWTIHLKVDEIEDLD